LSDTASRHRTKTPIPKRLRTLIPSLIRGPDRAPIWEGARPETGAPTPRSRPNGWPKRSRSPEPVSAACGSSWAATPRWSAYRSPSADRATSQPSWTRSSSSSAPSSRAGRSKPAGPSGIRAIDLDRNQDHPGGGAESVIRFW